MNRQEFESKNTSKWQSFEAKVEAAERNHKIEGSEELPSTFRKVCYDLSLAQYRMFGHRICDHLNVLAIRGYRVIHRTRGVFGANALKFCLVTFPRAVRNEWKLACVVSFVFWLPLFLMWWLTGKDLIWAQAILGSEGMSSLEGMYGKNSDTVEHLRSEHGSNFRMFGHYIKNNVGIDFKLFAGGIAFGIGTLFFLIFNGIYFGAVLGYVAAAGDPEKLWRFVAGHSSFELLGMLVVGMAGLKMGFALLAPGQLSRSQALTKAGRDGLPLLIGGALMTALAAVVEGFWSAQPIAADVKYTVGITFWVLHVLYFVFAGRRSYGA
ncbi:stage II sporulation protein M [Verrucomicrobiaceae bacterium 227]